MTLTKGSTSSPKMPTTLDTYRTYMYAYFIEYAHPTITSHHITSHHIKSQSIHDNQKTNNDHHNRTINQFNQFNRSPAKQKEPTKIKKDQNLIVKEYSGARL